MEQYFFDLSECGDLFVDEEGAELADLAAVRRHAIVAARDLMAAEVREGRICLSCRIDVRNAAGEHVLALPFRDAVTVSGI